MFIDGKPYEVLDSKTSVEAKINDIYYSILDSAKERISPAKNIDITKIKDFRFIVKKDTIIISVDEILAHSENKNKDLESMFKEIKKWEVYVDYFPFDDMDVDGVVNEELKVNHGTKSDYKVYILHTVNWKFNVIKI
jgi:hypothetical protein